MLNYQTNLAELKQIKDSIVLQQDPVSQGLNYFTQMFQKIQACKDRVLSMVMDAIWNKTLVNAEASEIKEDYNRQLGLVLVREDVMPLKSQDLRNAVANNSLTTILSQMTSKEREAFMADAYYKNCMIVYEELKSKNENLVQQFNTVRAMLSIDPSLKDAMSIPPLQITRKEA